MDRDPTAVCGGVSKKLFVNSANVEIVRRLVGIGIVDGITTNLSVIAAEGKDFQRVVTALTQSVARPALAQVTGRSPSRMVEQAREIASEVPTRRTGSCTTSPWVPLSGT